jgi:hypothetical protein
LGSKGNPIMQIRQSAAGVGGHQVTIEPEGAQRWEFVDSNQDEVMALLKPGDDRKRVVILAGGALLVGLAVGWAFATTSAVFNITETEAPPRRLAEIKSSGKTDAARRTASVSPAGASLAKAEGGSPTGTRLSGDAVGPPLANQANSAPGAREPIVAVPETKPTTIAGWTVLEVRGGTVVLEGPDGVWTAARGDIVPGVGRIDSIVRWGNRWIVATASGLIADP